jgi:hypothetical protein
MSTQRGMCGYRRSGHVGVLDWIQSKERTYVELTRSECERISCRNFLATISAFHSSLRQRRKDIFFFGFPVTHNWNAQSECNSSLATISARRMFFVKYFHVLSIFFSSHVRSAFFLAATVAKKFPFAKCDDLIGSPRERLTLQSSNNHSPRRVLIGFSMLVEFFNSPTQSLGVFQLVAERRKKSRRIRSAMVQLVP